MTDEGKRTVQSEMVVRQRSDGWWCEITVDRQRWPDQDVGPFASQAEAERGAEDFRSMMRACGALDIKGRA